MGNHLSTDCSLPSSSSANLLQSPSYTYQPCSPYVVSYTSSSDLSSAANTVRPGRGSAICRSPRTATNESGYHYYCCFYGSDNNLPYFCGVASSTCNNMGNGYVNSSSSNNKVKKKYLNADEAISDGEAFKRVGKIKSAIEAFQIALIIINNKYNFCSNNDRMKSNENRNKNIESSASCDVNDDAYEDVPLNSSSSSSPFIDKQLFSSSMTPPSPSSAQCTSAAITGRNVSTPVLSSTTPPLQISELSPRNSDNTSARSRQASCPSTAYPPSEASSRLSSAEMPSEGGGGDRKPGSTSSYRSRIRSTETCAMIAEKYTRVLDMLGELFVCEKEYEHAIHCYNLCIHVCSNNTCLNESEDGNNCTIGEYSRKIRYNSHYVCTYYYKKGVVLQMRGSFEDACECFRQALKINPAYAPALFNLGVIKMNCTRNTNDRNNKSSISSSNSNIGVSTADINEAITVFKHLLSLDDNNYNNTEVMILLSNCYEILCDYEEGLSYLYMARGMDKSNYRITREIQKMEAFIK